ncbi:hypothetical protein KI387_000339, partial [Taxus chinensis]
KLAMVKLALIKADLNWNLPSLGTVVTDTTHKITFYWPPEFGTPGAIIVTNKHVREFFLKNVSIHFAGHGDNNFLCNSWIYPTWMGKVCSNFTAERVFFANNSYLPEETPVGLVSWRRAELVRLKGDGTGKRETWDRVYDYDVYNDLGDPDNDKNLQRTVKLMRLESYIASCLSPSHQDDDVAWMKDEEFARQTLSGANPIVIQCLQVWLPSSKLNIQIYGPQESSITDQHLLPYLDGIFVDEGIESKRLFVLDYYDAYIPYVKHINELAISKVYATRTVFFLLSDGTLKPIAIELCLPPTSVGLGERRVFTPDSSGEEKGWLWQLAKAHVKANDSGYHQIVSHWLRTHAAVEPFIIATHRNMSKLHPIHKLLVPHFRNTMDINRVARQSLINVGGVIEKCFSAGPFGMEISSKAYVEWRFNEQGLPADLLKRGMAIPDPTNEANGLKLVVEDYPYAVDGLEIWGALKSWVCDYTSLYYRDDQTVESDEEVQAWWKEIIEVGHGDKKHDQVGWYKMNTLNDLNEAITTLIWVASAHHAAVNFGQYGYAGFMPNLPTTTRRLVPQKGSEEYSKLLKEPEAYFLETLTDPETATTTMAVLEILFKHSSDEIYLGQGSTTEWVEDSRVVNLFQQFRLNLFGIEKQIMTRNVNPDLKNRCGA